MPDGPPSRYGSFTPTTYQPPADPAERRQLVILGALFLVFLLLSIFCWFMLSLHSPLRPSVETGHTEALHFPAGRGGRMMTIYVQPAEAVVCIGLFLGSVIAPGCYLVWDFFRKRRPPR
ncbi:hypothetical protein ACFQU7_20235 [Pseudoroseomonas wenyumeiae]